MIVIDEHVSFGRVEEETLIVHSKTGGTIKLDSQGTQIWNLIYKGFSKDEIKNHFMEKYPDDKEKIEKDIDNFLEELKKEKFTKE